MNPMADLYETDISNEMLWRRAFRRLLCSLGAHKLILGCNKAAVVRLVVTLLVGLFAC